MMYAKLAVSNVRKSLRDFAIYFVTLALGVCVFYAFNSIEAQQVLLGFADDDRKQILDLMTTYIQYASVVVALVLAFLIIYANRFLVKRRQKEFGIYLVLGMDHGKVMRVLTVETLLVGTFSLICGLVLGFCLSQAMLYLTAALFGTQIEQFHLVFSANACIQTVVCFAIVFAVALLINLVTVGQSRLITLINADRKSEPVTLRSLPLSIILFIVSIGIIYYSYHLLIQTGLLALSRSFAEATTLMIVGTFLLFFSLSGIFLKIAQASHKLYYRGLNMFVFRQLASQINTAFASISIVAVTLFFAITTTASGLGIVSGFNSMMEKLTVYDVSVYSINDNLPKNVNTAYKQADGSIAKALEQCVPSYHSYARDSAQIDIYEVKGLSLKKIYRLSGVSDANVKSVLDDLGIRAAVTPLSQYNHLREMLGKPAIKLGDNECLVWYDNGRMKKVYDAFLQKNVSLPYMDTKLHLAQTDDETPFETKTLDLIITAQSLFPII